MYLFLLVRGPSGQYDHPPLHSTMYLFLLMPDILLQICLCALHSTMYLFLPRISCESEMMINLYIPQCIYFYMCTSLGSFDTVIFTFHNVSISTFLAEPTQVSDTTLHSTMYLFLPNLPKPYKAPEVLYIPQCIYFYWRFIPFCYKHKHLYIPQCIYFYHRTSADSPGPTAFTFHNVSISTKNLSFNVMPVTHFTFHNVSISTMRATIIVYPFNKLYIPQCIYFYAMQTWP